MDGCAEKIRVMLLEQIYFFSEIENEIMKIIIPNQINEHNDKSNSNEENKNIKLNYKIKINMEKNKNWQKILRI